MSNTKTVVIEVIPEGLSIGQHTSVLFDLKDRALAYLRPSLGRVAYHSLFFETKICLRNR
ncbi:hypothetical protein Avbf_17150 [Armadillidium vulgare]|nr:hypothetical protein Avbf_17150 [Armadillidium vulgare]